MSHDAQHTSENWPLKGATLVSANKYTTLLPLAWLIKPVSLQFGRVLESLRPTSFCFWLSRQKSMSKSHSGELSKKFPRVKSWRSEKVPKKQVQIRFA